MTGSLLFQSLVLGILLGGLYALLAAGLTLYFGVMRVVMIAHAAFLVLAAYLAWDLHERLGVDPLVSLVVTVPLFFVLGVGFQRLLIARLRPATVTMMSVLLTFAAALTIEGLLGFVYSGTQRRVQLSYSAASIEVLGAQVAVVKLIAFGLAAVSLLGLFLLLTRSRFGQALRATIQHPQAARLIGIDTDRVAGYGFGLGLATAAIGGTALSLDSTIYPSLHWNWIGPLMAIIVVGGLGSIPGAAIAAMVLG
ncbi:MAG: branched-chain amino acid ABC transporter permease, partial [Pseudonocardia sp.]